MLDRNKTALTHAVTDAASAYLLEAGFKPVETEVAACDGWKADLAGVARLTPTEATALKLTAKKPRYRKFDEVWTPGREARYDREQEAWEASVAALPPALTCVVEVKTSRGDFRADGKWSRPSPADVRLLAVPAGMISQGEYPEGWGVLVRSERGGVRLARPPAVLPVDEAQRFRLVLALAERQHNRVRYAAHREEQQGYRLHANADVTRARVRDAVNSVIAIAAGRGGSVEEVLARYRSINAKSLEGMREQLEALWGVFDVADPDAVCLNCGHRKLRV